jgi:UDP-N-acetyl-D-mannosaminuronate dehydrogenase
MKGLTQKIVVKGFGYMGLPTESIHEAKEHRPLGVDVCSDVSEAFSAGGLHISRIANVVFLRRNL